MVVIRGAITINENTEQAILSETEALLKHIIEKNQLHKEDIISIHFSATKDLTKAYPAVAARQIGLVHAGLFCVQEMFVEESMKMCIRVMIYVNKDVIQKEVSHVYLKDAAHLRPDFS